MATWPRSDTGRVVATLLLAASLLQASASGQVLPPKGSSMKIVSQPTPRISNEIEVPLAAPRRAPLALPPPAVPPAGASYPQPYANERQNGRVGALKPGRLAVLWRSELMAGHRPRFVLAAGGSTVVQATAWQSFGAQGQALATGRTGAGQMCVDGENAIVYSLDPNGFIAANATATGKRAFIIMPGVGDMASFSYVSGRGRELLTAGSSGPQGNFEQMGTAPVPPAPPRSTSVLELVRLPENTQDAAGSLLTGARTSRVQVVGSGMVAAQSGEHIVFALAQALFFLDRELNVRHGYALDGSAMALSLDEGGRAYVVLDAGGRRELWLLSPSGELGFVAPLPASADRVPLPAVIGYDHRVFVVSGSRLLALDPTGHELWSQALADKPAGLVVLPNGTLLVSEGAELVAYDPQGKRSRVFEFPGEQIATPAATTAAGGMLVATDKALYSLGAR